MLTPDAQKKALEDLLDPQKVSVYCGTHFYFGMTKLGHGNKPLMPAKGCAKCWFVFFLTSIAMTPPSERQAALDELECVVRKCCEMADKDEFDFEAFDRPQIQIDRDVN